MEEGMQKVLAAGAADQSSPTYIVLQHPSGAMVYVLGTAHIDPASAADARALIERVAPSAVVVELDAERYRTLRAAAEGGDAYGARRLAAEATAPRILAALATGRLFGLAMGLFYAVAGAAMGARPGGEFVAAAEAAEARGAALVLGDRPQGVTLRRLQHYAARAAREAPPRRGGPSGGGDGGGGGPAGLRRRMERQAAREAGGGVGVPLDPFPSDEGSDASTSSSDALAPSDPWGIAAADGGGGGALDGGPAAASDTAAAWEAGARRRALRMMRAGGCAEPEAALSAGARLLRAGLEPGGRVDPADLLAVRACGRQVVAAARRAAMAGEDAWAHALEAEAAAGAARATGAPPAAAALRRVLVDERDAILARRLWEAGEAAGAGGAVVGVVGAGHVQGVRRRWPAAGSAAAAAEADALGAPPPRGGSLVGTAATVGALGYVALKRPRAAAYFAGGAALLSAPYLGLAVVSVKRLARAAGRLADAAEELEAASGAAAAEAAAGWGEGEGGGGGGEWR